MKIKAENAARFSQHCILLLRLSGAEVPDLSDEQNFRGSFYQGFKIYQKLSRLESRAHRLAEDECNGVIAEDKAEKISERIKKQVAALLPDLKGFFINGDPRGYALKIVTGYKEEEKYIRELGIYRDFGGFGILAPEF